MNDIANIGTKMIVFACAKPPKNNPEKDLPPQKPEETKNTEARKPASFCIATTYSIRYVDIYQSLKEELAIEPTTVETIKAYIKNINKLLACNDIPVKEKARWENKKASLEMEIQRLENEAKKGTIAEEFDNIAEEITNFKTKYKTFDETKEATNAIELKYRIMYYEVLLSYEKRILENCELTDNMKQACNTNITNYEALISDLKEHLESLE